MQKKKQRKCFFGKCCLTFDMKIKILLFICVYLELNKTNPYHNRRRKPLSVNVLYIKLIVLQAQ